MPQNVSASVENNFIGGLKTEFTALKFPENACTDTDNCVFTLVGNVLRREGIDFELNYASKTITSDGKALNTYKWNNVGGDGLTQILVAQVGAVLYFFRSTDATIASPLSTTLLASTIDIHDYQIDTVTSLGGVECQFTDGNGYLFVFHPSIQPIYLIYNAGTITATSISIQVRDFAGIQETGVPTSLRPTTLTAEHSYNLANQGWSSSPSWTATSSSSFNISTGSKVFVVASGLSITLGQPVNVRSNGGAYAGSMSGTVTAYSGTNLTINITALGAYSVGNPNITNWLITPINLGLLDTWHTAEGNYPSNADVWWRFKNSSGVFDPATTQPNVTLGTGPAPSGFYVLDAFSQTRSAVSGIAGLTSVLTNLRPKTGTWFQGRVWYSGVDASQQATGDASYYTWTENIYFSQTVTDLSQFGMCYQNNDPTSEDLFDLLPTDGGVITIQGSGSIFKLFPVQNGLLVFAANGIWFITGSQGIGFSANDYTITKISNIQCVSSCAFINVLGWPLFWNEEGIYTVTPSQQGGGLTVDNLCYGTILTYYSQIPIMSKRFARGDYNPIDFTVSWVFRSTVETDINDRYKFDSVLNLNTASKAFYPYSIDTALGPLVRDIKYIAHPGGSSAPSPTMKYLTAIDATHMTFSEERDQDYVDFYSFNTAGTNFDSYFITGYKLHGKALTKWQPIYVQMYSNASVPTAYKIQGIWDFANSGNSGRYSNVQEITNALTRFGVIYRKHRIRGKGISLQLKVQSVDGLPFDIIGWASQELINTSM